MWVVTGDGDGLSIGGNHLIHALRRNVNIKILLFNNQIYGLTKGQYRPPARREGHQVDALRVARPPLQPDRGRARQEASFVAHTLDNDRGHLTEVLRQAAAHPGAAFVEIYQNCNVFNDGAFDYFRDKESGKQNQIRLEHGGRSCSTTIAPASTWGTTGASSSATRRASIPAASSP